MLTFALLLLAAIMISGPLAMVTVTLTKAMLTGVLTVAIAAGIVAGASLYAAGQPVTL